jgi:hypothetical protein
VVVVVEVTTAMQVALRNKTTVRLQCSCTLLATESLLFIDCTIQKRTLVFRQLLYIITR